MTIRKILPYLLGLLFLAFLIRQAMGNGDFAVFLEASKLVRSGINPYDKWIPISEGHACLYFYSPLWALLLIPFSSLPNFIPNFLWLLLNAWCTFRILKLLAAYFDYSLLSIKQRNLIIGLTLALSLRFILYNFSLIQVTLFLLWGSLESLRLFRDKKYLPGAMLLAFVINIKILPLILLPYLLYRKEFKGFVLTVVCYVAYIFIPAVVLGWKFNTELLFAWWGTINPSNAEHLLETGLGPHSLTALIPVMLTPSTGEINITRNLMNLSPDSAILIMNCVRLGLILLTFCFIKWPPFTTSKSKYQELHELAYLFLVVPLIFPHQQKYAFVFMIPAVFYISTYLVLLYKRKNAKDQHLFRLLIFLSLLFFILTTLTTDGLIGKQANQWTQHFKLITYGMLVLVIVLIKCNPEKILPQSETSQN
ncbi:MAG: DUF2029 domain-containing protein [Bacteroidetes bacterium]|nr:DUF2029 domain-containing protein [Bacteroidota bacterium]